MKHPVAALLVLAAACAATPAAPDAPASSSTSAPPLATAHPLDLHRTVEARGRFGISFALPSRSDIEVRFVASSALRERTFYHPDSDVVERGEALDVLCPGHRVSDCLVVDSIDGADGHVLVNAGAVPRYASFVWENPAEAPVAIDVHFELPKGARVFSDVPRDE